MFANFADPRLSPSASIWPWCMELMGAHGWTAVFHQNRFAPACSPWAPRGVTDACCCYVPRFRSEAIPVSCVRDMGLEKSSPPPNLTTATVSRHRSSSPSQRTGNRYAARSREPRSHRRDTLELSAHLSGPKPEPPLKTSRDLSQKSRGDLPSLRGLFQSQQGRLQP